MARVLKVDTTLTTTADAPFTTRVFINGAFAASSLCSSRASSSSTLTTHNSLSPPLLVCPAGMLGAGLGSLSALIHTVMVGPASARAAQAAFASTLLSTAPFTAGAGALYTLGASLAEEVAGARDWRSSAAGGVLAGAVTVGLKQRSLQGGFVGALALGSACAAAQVGAALESSTTGHAHKAAPRPVALSGSELAASAASSKAFVGRMQ